MRVQGTYVSDKEIESVVDFVKNQMVRYYDEDDDKKTEQIQAIGCESGLDPYFVEAGKFMIEKDKASIGMIQRVFKIGFNRAARIMDQLTEAGVAGEEIGTKPRRVIMSFDQFEQLIGRNFSYKDD